MNLEVKIQSVTKEDPFLIELTYRSIFYQRKEFEYIRIPPVFLERYENEKEFDVKCAIYNDKPIATLGIIYYTGNFNGKKVKIGVFVDNCILPEYEQQQDKIFKKLFNEIEQSARQKNAEFIVGWEYKKKYNKKINFFTNLGFKAIDGFNWFPGGADLNWAFSKKGEYPLSGAWKIGLRLYYLKHKFFEMLFQRQKEIKIEDLQKEDLTEVLAFLTAQNSKYNFSIAYDIDTLKENIEKYKLQGIIAKKNGKIAGVLLYFISCWSGLMVGTPFYTKTWGNFLSWTPSEFIVKNNDEKIGSCLLLELLHRKGVKKFSKNMDYSFAVELFDRSIEWKRNAYTKTGFEEPDYDLGVALIKSLNEKTSFSSPVYIPNHIIVTPFLIDKLKNKENEKYF